MKRALFNDFRLTLAVLVLAAATIDLMMPSQQCSGPGIDSEELNGSEKALVACAALPATIGNGLREP